jgi:hypothetical protein
MTTKRIYLDSCCFIELALDATNGKLAEGGKFVWYLRTLLRAARDKQVTVLTSMFTLAECVSAKGAIDERVQQLFRSLLGSGSSGVTPWQMDIFVLDRARDLRWKHGVNLRPADSVHVATALESRCDEFLTWDGANTQARRSIMKAATPLAAFALTVCVPSDTKCIPDEYRQQQLAVIPGGKTDETRRK